MPAHAFCQLQAVLLSMLLLCSCGSLNLSVLQNQEKIAFEPLKLVPALEPNNMRLDLWRQSRTEQVNDSTTQTDDSPYHPLGFDLGNNLFFDLNDNLSIRIDELLGLTGQACWSVARTDREKQRRVDCQYTLCRDTLTVAGPPFMRRRYVNHRVTDGGTVSVMFRKRLQYAVDFSSQSTVYRYRRQKLDVLTKTGDNEYTLKQGFSRNDLRLQGNRLLLKHEFIVELTDNNNKIKIIRPGLFSNRVLLTLERSGDCLYLYDRHHQGSRVEFTRSGIAVYHNGHFQVRWNRVPL